MVTVQEMLAFTTGACSSIHPGFRKAQSLLSCMFDSPPDHDISTFKRQERQKINAARFAENVRQFGDGTHINNAYITCPEWKEDFWGAHYEDLLKVKVEYDPDNLFYCYHCVGLDKVNFGYEFESSGAPTYGTERVSVINCIAPGHCCFHVTF